MDIIEGQNGQMEFNTPLSSSEKQTGFNFPGVNDIDDEAMIKDIIELFGKPVKSEDGVDGIIMDLEKVTDWFNSLGVEADLGTDSFEWLNSGFDELVSGGPVDAPEEEQENEEQEIYELVEIMENSSEPDSEGAAVEKSSEPEHISCSEEAPHREAEVANHREAVDHREAVNHPAHYNIGGIEAIDVIEAWDLNFCLGNVLKYIARAGHKTFTDAGILEDLKKARWYLDREICSREKRFGAGKGVE